MLPDESLLKQHLRTMRILFSVKFMALVSYIAFPALLRPIGDQPVPDFPVLSLAMIAITLATVHGSSFLANLTVANARRRLAMPHDSPEMRLRGFPPVADNVDFWCEVYNCRLMLATCPADICVPFWGIVYTYEGAPWSLVAATVLLGLMALQYPTRQGLQNWIAEQRGQLSIGQHAS